MIRVALMAAALVAFCLSGQAQGIVTFANSVNFNTPADRLVRDISGAPLIGTNFLAQLYYGASDAPASSLQPVSFAPATFRVSTTGLPGTWMGGNRTLAGFVVPQTVNLQVRVWDGNFAQTYEEAESLGFGGTQHGVSTVFSYLIPIPPEPSSEFYIENFRGFTLVPEPSLALLAAIGIVALHFRRR
jgi:hypothetical protein